MFLASTPTLPQQNLELPPLLGRYRFKIAHEYQKKVHQPFGLPSLSWTVNFKKGDVVNVVSSGISVFISGNRSNVLKIELEDGSGISVGENMLEKVSDDTPLTDIVKKYPCKPGDNQRNSRPLYFLAGLVSAMIFLNK